MEDNNSNNNNQDDQPPPLGDLEDDSDDEEMPVLLGRRQRRHLRATRLNSQSITWQRNPPSVSHADLPPAVRKLSAHDGINIDDNSHKRKKVNPDVGANVAVSGGEVEVEVETKKKCPPATRSIVENDASSELIRSTCVCRKCKKVDSMALTFPSVAVTTIPEIRCSNCGISNVSSAAPTGLPAALRKGKDKVTDFACNILYVVSFLSSGDGGTEAQRLMGMLGLPHAQSMEKDTFSKVEKAMAPALWSVVQQALTECLQNEVKETMIDDPDFDYDAWERAMKQEGVVQLHSNNHARLSASMDMGWQKKGSGRRCDSLSGHACLIGMTTRKPIALCIKIKACNFCDSCLSEGWLLEDIPDHDCLKNHEGSSGSMESSALLCMLEEMQREKKASVPRVVTDDDSKMKAQTKWSNEDYLTNVGRPRDRIQKKDGTTKAPEGGNPPSDVPEPLFLADPAHRKKILRDRLYAVSKRKKAERHDLNEGDIVRLTTNYTCMVNQISFLDQSEWEEAARAVLEHHFDNHQFCGEFCHKRKKLQNEFFGFDLDKEDDGSHETKSSREAKSDQEDTDEPKKFYRSHVKDEALCVTLKEIIDDFTTMDRLKEVAHGFDTNANEALNNLISWMAPKNKTCCFSSSLKNRVSIAVAIFCFGHVRFYEALFANLGMRLDPPTGHYLETKERQRQAAINKSKTAEAKKKRNKKTCDKVRRFVQQSLRDRANNDGHGTGVAMDEGNETGVAEAPAKCYVHVPICRSCNQPGHKTSGNKKCVNYKPRASRLRKQAKDDGEGQALMDSIPLNNQDERTIDLAREVARPEKENDEN